MPAEEAKIPRRYQSVSAEEVKPPFYQDTSEDTEDTPKIPVLLISSGLGGGVDFPKSFKKFDALARKKKFPEISRARRLGQRYFPKYHVSEGWTSSNLPQTSDFGGFGGLKTNGFFAFGAPIHGKTVFRQCRRICWHKSDILKAWFMVIQRNF